METEINLLDIGPDNDTVCTICNAEFLDPEDLTVHLMQIHSSETPSLVPCHFCQSNLSDLEAYACHVRDYHLTSLKLCAYCSKAFTDIDKLKSHERKHYSAKKNKKKCSQCSILFDNTSHLEQHEYEHHNNTFDGIMLHDYSPIFSSVFNIKLFSLLRSIGSNGIHSCMTCKYRSHDLKKYIKHLQVNECRSFTCNNCSNTYRGKKNVFKHVKMNNKCGYFTKNLENEQECPHCFKHINSIFFFNHIKQCKPIKCQKCKIVFKSLSGLSEHQAQEHPVSVEVEMCKFCSRQCVGMNAIMKHMTRVHKQDLHLYRYKCVECETVFKHPKKLFAHYFINHKELEPYTCKICDIKFRIRKKFTIHIKLDHKSVGFVEFDKNYHVFFSDTKSENPFTPTCVIPEEELLMYDEYEEQIEANISEKQNQNQSNEELNLDGLNQSETEGHSTELETEVKNNNLKRKNKSNKRVTKRFKRRNVETISLNSSDDDDDEPLVSLTKPRQVPTKKPLQMLFRMKKNSNNNRKRLTCNKCNKYCYTFQNYQHHMSLHKKNEQKHCIKCFKVFKSKEKLNKHIETEHSSSKLTETLKLLIEKRKKGITMEAQKTSKREKFMNTIKKAKTESNNVTATLKLVEKDLSLQKFIENFTPESNDVSKNKNAIIENSVTIKIRNSPFYREPIIKMTKFESEPISMSGKLALPVKFKQDNGEKVTVTLRLVDAPANSSPKFTPRHENMNDHQEDHYSDHFNDTEQYKSDTIPEVAEEILLEETEELPKPVQIPHKIVIPKLPEGCKQISIAHLLPEAPFFKIVKVKDMLYEEEKEVERKDFIKLADGTKLVTVNPLAHLLGDKKVEHIISPGRNKYYKPKMGRNVENLFNKAIEKANTPTNTRKKRSKVQDGVSDKDN